MTFFGALIFGRGCLFLAVSPIKLKKSINQLIKKRKGYREGSVLEKRPKIREVAL